MRLPHLKNRLTNNKNPQNSPFEIATGNSELRIKSNVTKRVNLGLKKKKSNGKKT